MTLGERIKALRIDQTLTQKELGKRLNVSEVSVRCWENGTKNPSMNAIVDLATLFEVSTDYLLGVTPNEQRDRMLLDKREKTLLSNYRVLDPYGKEAVDTICLIERRRIGEKVSDLAQTNIIQMSPGLPHRYIPRYSTPAAAGYAAPLDGEDFEMILVDDTVPPDADFAVKIQGDSMYPYIRDGDTVYVKKDCEFEVGDVGIFCVDGSTYCKQYFVDKDKNLILVSANPELRNTNVFVGTESGSYVKCYGKVLGINIKIPDYII